MPVTIVGDRTKNEIHVNDVFMQKSHGAIILGGAGNVVIIDTPKPCANVMMNLNGKSRFEMRLNAQVAQFNLFLRDGSQAIIGKNTVVNGKLSLSSHERAMVSIGQDCIIGGGLHCMTSDMHSIIDIESDERINPPGDVIIEDKVWIGLDVMLLKATRIGRGSVVGARSTVSGAFDENSLIVGYPARVARQNITWKSALVPMPRHLDHPHPVSASH